MDFLHGYRNKKRRLVFPAFTNVYSQLINMINANIIEIIEFMQTVINWMRKEFMHLASCFIIHAKLALHYVGKSWYTEIKKKSISLYGPMLVTYFRLISLVKLLPWRLL